MDVEVNNVDIKLKDLIKQYPNDYELGKQIRELYLSYVESDLKISSGEVNRSGVTESNR